MKEKIAIHYLKNLGYKMEGWPLKSGKQAYIQAIRIATDALEKQVPKKPSETVINGWRWIAEYYCPACNNFITDNIDEDYSRCCDECGQAIDWSEDEEEL